MKKLVAVDGSHCTNSMLQQLADQPGLAGGPSDYVVLTVVPLLPDHVLRYVDRATMEDYYQSSANEVLEPVKAFFAGQGWEARFLHLTGYPPQVIADIAASENVDLICLGTHGRSSMKSAIMGSVVNGVLTRTKVPVLLFQ